MALFCLFGFVYFLHCQQKPLGMQKLLVENFRCFSCIDKMPSSSLVGLIALIILLETVAQYHIKKSKLSNNIYLIFIAVILYATICLLLRMCYSYTSMGMTNFIWSVMSIVTVMVVGYFFFNETITHNDAIGIVFCMIGLYLIFVVDHQ